MSSEEQTYAEYMAKKIEYLKSENKRYREALEKIAKEGCMAVTIRGEIRDVFCVQTAKSALEGKK